MKMVQKEHIQKAITQFLDYKSGLTEALNKLNEAEQKLNQLLENNEADQINKQREKVLKLKQNVDDKKVNRHEKFDLEIWMDFAANKMVKWLQFGTHISKGVHPDSKGDSINFNSADTLPEGMVGSQILSDPPLDATGNAAGLPVANFFEILVNDNLTIRDLIVNDHPALEGVFSQNVARSAEHQASFKEALISTIKKPITDGYNKQLLWPGMDAIRTDNYTCIVPLHPSSLVYTFYQKLNHQRFNDENKQAKDNRKKKKVDHQSYVTVNDIAVTKLGSTKPQTVSLLNTRQGGRNYLLPSIPPKFKQISNYQLRKHSQSIFDQRLSYHCHHNFYELFKVFQVHQNTIEQRQQRQNALDGILFKLLQIAQSIQTTYKPGWSKVYQIPMAQKYWLDPHRDTVEEEQEFVNAKETTDWSNQIAEQFAAWINSQLKKRFKKQGDEFSDPEFLEWKRQAQAAIKASQRRKKGVFK